MRVESTPAELRGDTGEIERSGHRGKRFRTVLSRRRRSARHRETVVEPRGFTHERPTTTGMPFATTLSGGVPPSGLARVESTESMQPSIQGPARIQAKIAIPGRGSVDLTVRNGSEGVLVSMTAAPVLAERLSRSTGTLGRRLSVRHVRTRQLRVRSTGADSLRCTRDSGR